MATLASRFGWSYETLMAMSGAERRLWLAAAARLAPAAPAASASTVASAPAVAPRPDGPTSSHPMALPLSSDAERRARLMELHEQLNHRGR